MRAAQILVPSECVWFKEPSTHAITLHAMRRRSRTAEPLCCPACANTLTGDALNAARDLATCSAHGCGWTGSLSALRLENELGIRGLDVDAPPPGCGIERTADGETLTAGGRNWSLGGFFLVFSLFWNAVSSVFVFIALLESADALGLIPPGSVQMPTDENGQRFGEQMPGGLAFFWLFLTPFILVGIGTASAALFFLVGRLDVEFDAFGQARVRHGLPRPLPALTRRFDPDAVEAVEPHLHRSKVQQNGRHIEQAVAELQLTGRPPMRLGFGLPPASIAWLIAALRERFPAR